MEALFGTTNYGSYYGNGVQSSSNNGGGSSSGGRQRPATSMNIEQFSRNNGSNYSAAYEKAEKYFANGEIDRAMAILNAIQDEYKDILQTDTNYNVTDYNMESVVNNGFRAATGRTYDEAANLDSEFVNEFKKSLGFGLGSFFTSDYSSEELLEITEGRGKDDVSNKTKVKGVVGAAAGGAISGAAVVGGIFLLTSATFSLPLLIAGGAVGAAICGAKKFFGKE